MVLYRAPECYGFEHAWKYLTICCISFHPCKSIRENLTDINWSRPTQAHHVNKLGSTGVPDAVYHVSRSSAFLVSKKVIFEVFFSYMDLEPILAMWPRTFEHIFIPNIPWTLHIKFGFNSLVFLRKRSLKMLHLNDRGQRSMNEYNHFLTICTNFQIKGFSSFAEIYSLSIFRHKSKMDQIWPCCKIDQGQLRVIIWINLVALVNE